MVYSFYIKDYTYTWAQKILKDSLSEWSKNIGGVGGIEACQIGCNKETFIWDPWQLSDPIFKNF